MRVILGVGGGIAAYKAAALLRLFTESGHDVTVIPTEASLRFVGLATWEALSGNPVSVSVFDRVDQVNHVKLGHEADLVVLAPATADVLAKAATGLAGDLLGNTLLVATAPIVFAPAMHTQMWQHPATQANVELLRVRGAVVLEPDSGRLTGSDSGPGRLPEPERIYAAALEAVRGRSGDSESQSFAERNTGKNSGEKSSARKSLSGCRIVVTAGGTIEPLDPVRYLGNRSSGKQGVALALAAQAAGATVTLIAAHIEVPVPEGISVVSVETAHELQNALNAVAFDSDIVLMAAAVADFRPDHTETAKIKKRDDRDDPVLTLVRNPDILHGLVQERRRRREAAAVEGSGASRVPVIVGFAAETGDENGAVLDYARSKLSRKGCDVLVVNQVGPQKPGGPDRVFGQDSSEVMILQADSDEVTAVKGSKDEIARAVLQLIVTEFLNHAH